MTFKEVLVTTLLPKLITFSLFPFENVKYAAGVPNYTFGGSTGTPGEDFSTGGWR